MPSALEPMTALDKRCILALKPVRGLSANAQRIADHLNVDLRRGRDISIRQRNALYAICWRFRRQMPVELQAKVAIASADAHMMALLSDREGPSRIRSAHAFEVPSTSRRNPLDDLFNQGVAT